MLRATSSYIRNKNKNLNGFGAYVEVIQRPLKIELKQRFFKFKYQDNCQQGLLLLLSG
jgi:hypothetical protein